MRILVPFAVVNGNQSPNSRRGASRRHLNDYYKAIVVCMASVVRFSPSIVPILFTNEPPPLWVKTSVGRLGGEIQISPFRSNPAEILWDRFSASFYFVDALTEASHQTDVDESVVMLDPDCFVAADLVQLDMETNVNMWAYQLDYRRNANINGLTRWQAAAIASQMSKEDVSPYPHLGGEFLAVRGSVLGRVSDGMASAYADSLDRALNGHMAYTTEEHLLSYVLRNEELNNAADIVKRMWTGLRQRNVFYGDQEYCVWHLPSEKGHGFSRLYEIVSDSNSWFWTLSKSEVVRRCAIYLGISAGVGRIKHDLLRLSDAATDLLPKSV